MSTRGFLGFKLNITILEKVISLEFIIITIRTILIWE